MGTNRCFPVFVHSGTGYMALRELSKHWSAISTFGFVKAFWSKVECKKSIERLALSKVHIAVMRGILTGQCSTGTHALRLIILEDATCESCIKEDEAETSRHFLLDCLIFGSLIMNKHTPKQLTNLLPKQ